MKKNSLTNLTFLLLFVFSICNVFNITAQGLNENKSKSDFWNHVQFGGGLGLGFGSGYTNITIAPSAIYNFNEKVSLGIGTQYSYVNQKGFYKSNIYGGSIIGLINPIEQIQLSAELEQLKVNNSYLTGGGSIKDGFWNTALFIGAGYRAENITIGLRYNVLHKDRNNVYVDALMPFIRIYF
ncbi:hypothetical protein [Flavobacterium sp.]|jgi:hypothetical protein|uniref:hypothetical protein n=1 Tax=Flavobacterium sp. TaxID=239 RepID=UPI002A82A98D|nr:hypothetical protein [Flavobacterium sp.]